MHTIVKGGVGPSVGPPSLEPTGVAVPVSSAKSSAQQSEVNTEEPPEATERYECQAERQGFASGRGLPAPGLEDEAEGGPTHSLSKGRRTVFTSQRSEVCTSSCR